MSDETRLISQCLQQEEAAVERIEQHLINQQFVCTGRISHTRSHWHRAGHSVVVSLVDDVWDCSIDRSQDTANLFDANTTVITDNWINTPIVYQLSRLPDSFYGIYSYIPADQHWRPIRDYTFAVNRLQFLRMRILAQLCQHFGLDQGHVSFNCDAGLHIDAKQAFLNQLVYATQQEIPQFQQLANQMPLKNYSIGHEQAYTHSWLNITVETYSSDNVIALSEKIFRCLVTPVPWIAYSGRYTIERLRGLGFDVLDDVVDHAYDRALEANNKMQQFIECAKHSIEQAKNSDWSLLQARCAMAAEHNQRRLADMKAQWTKDFDAWLTAGFV